jgi:hypothetical protein
VGENRIAKRHKWRLPCEIVSDGRPQRAIVIDLSETGLFVQTGTRLPPGSAVEVRLLLPDATQATVLRARVARNKQVPQQLATVARGGVGLRILDAPRAYYATIAALEEGGAARAQGAAGLSLDAPLPPAAPPKTRFRVRVKQCDGPRSRSVEILADTSDEARARALAECGAGWEAVTADAI